MEALLCCLSYSLLSIMLLLLHHHFKTGHEDPPWHDSRSELIQHVFVDVVGEVESISLSCKISLVETERLFGLLSSGHRGFLILLAAFSLILQNLLI